MFNLGYQFKGHERKVSVSIIASQHFLLLREKIGPT